MLIQFKDQVQNTGRNMFELEGSQHNHMKIINIMDILKQAHTSITIKDTEYLLVYLTVTKDIQ
jgi:hypothetical protein